MLTGKDAELALLGEGLDGGLDEAVHLAELAVLCVGDGEDPAAPGEGGHLLDQGALVQLVSLQHVHDLGGHVAQRQHLVLDPDHQREEVPPLLFLQHLLPDLHWGRSR